MNLQYISDRSGHAMAVQIQMPIAEWNELKKKYKEFEEEEQAAMPEIPDWQIELGKKELQKIAEGKAEVTEWEKVKSRLKY